LEVFEADMGDVSRVHPGLDLHLLIGNPVIDIHLLTEGFSKEVVFEIDEETPKL
jgi:hypothetical protein